MRLIDADKLNPDRMTNKGTVAISQSQIAKTPTIQAVPIEVLEKIRNEIYLLHHHPKLDFIKNDEVVDMSLDVIDKYRKEQE